MRRTTCHGGVSHYMDFFSEVPRLGTTTVPVVPAIERELPPFNYLLAVDCRASFCTRPPSLHGT